MGLLEARRNSDWIGCIDFGTAMSKVALVKRKPRAELTHTDVVALAIGARDGIASHNKLLLPSIVYVTDQGLLFGQEAQIAALRGERLRTPFRMSSNYQKATARQCSKRRLLLLGRSARPEGAS
jgi:molecular chaperone DnaK (HSP70)